MPQVSLLASRVAFVKGRLVRSAVRRDFRSSGRYLKPMLVPLVGQGATLHTTKLRVQLLPGTLWINILLQFPINSINSAHSQKKKWKNKYTVGSGRLRRLTAIFLLSISASNSYHKILSVLSVFLGG